MSWKQTNFVSERQYFSKGMIWFDEKSTLKLQAGDDSRAAKLDQKINADKEALRAERDAILAELYGFGKPAFALAA